MPGYQARVISGDHPTLETLWERALSSWDDDRVHEALLQYGLRTQALPELAGRYRQLLDDPAHGARAKARIDAIIAAVTAQLATTKTPRRGPVPVPITLSAFGVCALLLGWRGWVRWGPK